MSFWCRTTYIILICTQSNFFLKFFPKHCRDDGRSNKRGGPIKEAGQAIGKTGDEGIEGIIKEDGLDLDAIYIQAKKCEVVIGRPEIHRFIGT
jgi:hypothetical protein